MNKKYSTGELTEIMQGMEKHPDDERIVYATDEDRNIAIPLVRDGHAKAVIYAHPDPDAFVAQTRAIPSEAMIEFQKTVDHRYLCMSKGDLIFIDQADLVNGKGNRLTRDELRYVTPVMSKAFAQISNMVAPHGKTRIMPFFRKAFHGKYDRAMRLHLDSVMTVHISGYNPIHYIIGDITPEQRSELLGISPDLNSMENMDSRLRSAEPGDLIVFGGDFVHCSPPTSEGVGQVNFAGEPYGTTPWPEDFNLEV